MKLFLKLVACVLWLFGVYESFALAGWLMNQSSDIAVVGGMIVIVAIIAFIAGSVKYLVTKKETK